MTPHELEAAALDLVNRAFEQPADQRTSWLNAACAGNPELLARVEMLLAADQATSALATSGGKSALHISPPRNISNYHIVRLIGSGGMGDVYAAERVDGQFKQKVAIKVVRAKPGDDKLLAQFAVERQILANLKHPNIVTLLDGGTTDQGLPFVVTELVEGVSLSRYLQDNALNLNEKLVLFDKICSAVEHAHAALVIHRDLKPNNVLVSNDGEPKLLDFGIAKVMTEDTELKTVVTALTPAYASPEQMAGQSLSTATDIYSLGAILYYMLTGTEVYQPADPASVEWHKLVTTGPIQKPSERLSTSSRQNPAGTKPEPKQKTSIPRDLDAIVLKALATKTERRYASVSSFRADLKSFLGRKPVAAQLDSTWYRAGLFISRHRTGFVATLVSISALVAALYVSIQQTQVANQQLTRAQAVADFMGDILMSPASRWDVELSAGPDARMSDVLTLAGDHISASLTEHPDVQVELLSRVAIALERLSKNDLSVELSARAMDIVNEIDSPELRLQALISHGKNLTRRGRSTFGLEALQTAKRMLEEQGDSRTLRYIYLLNDLGNAYGTFEQFTEQRATIQQAIALFNEVVDRPEHPALAGGYNHLAGVEMQLGNMDAARTASTRALAIVGLPKNQDDVVRAYVHMYATALEIIDRNYPQAREHGALAIQELKRSLGAQTKEVAVAMARLALVYALEGDRDNAQVWLSRSQSLEVSASYQGSRDERAADILVTNLTGEYSATLLKFREQHFRGTQYLLSLMGLFEYGLAETKAGDALKGQSLMQDAYAQIAKRYADSFLPHLDQRLSDLGVSLATPSPASLPN